MAVSIERRGSLTSRLAASTRIVVIEDESDIADFLRAYFRASGYDLIHVDPTSVDEVLAALVEHAPDCVLLDYGLRGFSGGTAHAALRDDARFDHVPVVVVTADVTAKRRVQAVAGAIDGFMAKPFNVNALAELVEERIRHARATEPVALEDASDASEVVDVGTQLDQEIRGRGRAVAFALVQVRCDAAARVRALREVAAQARTRLPEGSVLTRTEDDEIAVLVPGVDAGTVEPMLEHALAGVDRNLLLPGGSTVVVTLAAGLAGYPEHAATADGLYMAADAALADAVAAGAHLRVAI